jgi:hypothetical protein
MRKGSEEGSGEEKSEWHLEVGDGEALSRGCPVPSGLLVSPPFSATSSPVTPIFGVCIYVYIQT